MFEKLILKLKSLTVEPVPYDPAGLDDEIATKTSWSPAKGGGASFQTHRLVEIDPHRTEFRAAKGAVAFYGVFALIGVVSMSMMSLITLQSGGSIVALIFPALICLLFVAIGGGMLWFGLAPIVFDKRRGEYWKGHVAPYEAANREALKHFTKLGGIHALQIVSERCQSKNSSYYSYELNLVLEDGSRLNVVDHGNLERLREDAKKLSAFLGKPLWDAAAG